MKQNPACAVPTAGWACAPARACAGDGLKTQAPRAAPDEAQQGQKYVARARQVNCLGRARCAFLVCTRGNLPGVRSPHTNAVLQKLPRWLGGRYGQAEAGASPQTSVRAAAADNTPVARLEDEAFVDGEPASSLDSEFAADVAADVPETGSAQAALPAAAQPPPVLHAAAPGTPAEPPVGTLGWLPPAIGRYAVKGRMGSSPLAPVYEAWDPVSARPVAVVTVPVRPLSAESDARPGPADAQGLEQLNQSALDQARAVLGLVHPHIATVLDVGWSALGLYTVTPRLTGRDMRDALAQGWLPRPSAAAQIMCRVAEALAHAHAAGLVHAAAGFSQFPRNPAPRCASE